MIRFPHNAFVTCASASPEGINGICGVVHGKEWLNAAYARNDEKKMTEEMPRWQPSLVKSMRWRFRVTSEAIEEIERFLEEFSLKF
jgi:hypothetical protein